jgi:hypothetical protein
LGLGIFLKCWKEEGGGDGVSIKPYERFLRGKPEPVRPAAVLPPSLESWQTHHAQTALKVSRLVGGISQQFTWGGGADLLFRRDPLVRSSQYKGTVQRDFNSVFDIHG